MRISIIIPTYNYSKKIHKCLDSLLQQKYSFNGYEIIIVDDRSLDDTIKTLMEYEKTYSNVRLIANQYNRGVAESYNKGIDIAKGDIVVLTEQDCIYPDDYLEKISEEFGDPDVSCIMGTQISSGKWGTFLCQGRKAHVEAKEHVQVLKRLNRLETKNFAILRNIILKFKLDESVTPSHDIDLAIRLKKDGIKITYSDHIYVIHHADSFQGILARGRWYGRGQAKLYLKYKKWGEITNRKLGRPLSFNIIFYSAAFFYWLAKYGDLRGAFARAIMRVLMSVYFKKELKKLKSPN